MKPCKADTHWRKLKPPYTVGQNNFTYLDVRYGHEKWVDPKFCYPRMFDLVNIQVKSGEIPGWWDGREWDGYKLEQNDIVFYWRKRVDTEQY